jgi:hypothetical protein
MGVVCTSRETTGLQCAEPIFSNKHVFAYFFKIILTVFISLAMFWFTVEKGSRLYFESLYGVNRILDKKNYIFIDDNGCGEGIRIGYKIVTVLQRKCLLPAFATFVYLAKKVHPI